jgi:hypothetical protein
LTMSVMEILILSFCRHDEVLKMDIDDRDKDF